MLCLSIVVEMFSGWGVNFLMLNICGGKLVETIQWLLLLPVAYGLCTSFIEAIPATLFFFQKIKK